MANPEHVQLASQGAEAVARWRRQHPRERLDLSEADLHRADLHRADLHRANLTGANLTGANLTGANLTGAHLSWADLTGADLFGASLTRANLSGAKLSGAKLYGANLAGANLSEAICLFTAFALCDLAGCRGLESVVHQGPSSISLDTVTLSFQGSGNRLTPELEAFFRGAGVPQELLEALPRLLAGVRYCSCFIAYGEPDRAFAEKLRHNLVARGVSCWVYSLDATPGKRTWKEIGRKRREAEKMVVLCSAPALVRDGVLKETEEQMDEDPDKLVPVSLDNLWKEPGFRVMRGSRDLKPFLLDRNYADFSGGAVPYEEALARLLTGLEREPAP